jgi:hypothetical protein
MIRIARMKPEHFAGFRLQAKQSMLAGNLSDPDYILSLCNSGHAYAALADNRAVAFGGCLELWSDRAYAWMLIGEDAGPHFFTIVRAVAGFLAAAPWRRIEAAVACDFRNGHRLIRMLGFEFEGRMRAYSPDGADHDLYARIKNG